jgi:hypothetical protein
MRALLTQLKYFFVTNPGLGNGTMVTANTNNIELTQALSLPATGLILFYKILTKFNYG